MAIPPMVGVPALTLWLAGPSSRMGCPMPRAPQPPQQNGRDQNAHPQRDASGVAQPEHGLVFPASQGAGFVGPTT